MNYQDVKTFQELAEAIKEHIDSHRVPCTDVLRGEGVMYVNANKLSTTDARLAFIRLKNEFGVELPVPNNLIELLDSCGDADLKLQDKSEPKNVKETTTAQTSREIELIEQIIGQLEDWEKKYLPDNPQAGKIRLVDIVSDKPVKSLVRWLQWRKYQPEVDEVKTKCTKILRWFHTENGVLSKNLDDNPFVADEKGFRLQLTDLLRSIEENIKADFAPEKPAGTEQGADKKIYKGEEAWKKFEEKLSEFGTLEIPFYPFKAGKIKYWNLTGKSDICKYGAFRFSTEDLAIIKNTVGSTFNVSTLRAYLSAECNVQNPDNYSWKDILAALEHKLKTKTISEREGMIEVNKPFDKKRCAKIIGVLGGLLLITTLLINLKTIKEWFYPPRIQPSTSKGRQLPLTNENKLIVSLKEICKDIDSRPLAQQSDTAKQYVGIRIEEERLKLLDINEDLERDTYLLSMVFPDQSDTSYSTGRRILCDIPKEQHPELNLAKQGVELYISGQIKEAGAKYIELSDVSLKFD